MTNKVCLICKKEFKQSQMGNSHSYCSENCKRLAINLAGAKSYHIHKTERDKWFFSSIGIYYLTRTRAKNRDIEFNITKEDFINWYDNQNKKCIYCDRTEEQIKSSPRMGKDRTERRLSIDRLDNNKGYEMGNIGLACKKCNMIKSSEFTYEEMLEIGKIIKKRIL
jgi:endogenous inhibitor of DNA gyrase (YacG/DUF329 family)